MKIREILEKLISVPMNDLVDTIRSLLPSECEIFKSPLGNLAVRILGESAETILLDAHMDRIHFVVTGITTNGFVKVAPVGGIDCRVLSGCEVTVWGKEPLFGVFTIMPPHLKKADNSVASAVEEQAIDVGLSFEQASELITQGDIVTFRSNFKSLMNDRIVSAGFDNLAGVSVLISLAHKLVKLKLKHSVVLQFSNFEETGRRFAGGTTGAFSVSPQEAIVVDASFAKAPYLSYPTPGEIGKGVMIGFSPMLSKTISSSLAALSEENQIPYSQEVLGGSSGTNADGIVSVADGVPTGLVSYPLLNMHTGVEIVSESDLQLTERLLELYCQKGGAINE